MLERPSASQVSAAGIFGLAYLIEESSQLQIKAAQKGLEGDRTINKRNNEEQIRKIEEWGRKCARIAAKMKGGGVFGMFGRLSKFLSMATGIGLLTSIPGVKMPAVKAAISNFAFLSLGTAILSDISRAAGGPPLDTDRLIKGALTESLKACGVKASAAESVGKIMGGLGQGVINPAAYGEAMGEIASQMGADDQQVMIVSATFTVAASVAQMVALSMLTGGSSTAASLARNASTIQKASLIMQSMQAVDKGMINIEVAKATYEADKVQAQIQRVKALAETLYAQMNLNQEVLKEAYTNQTELTQMVSQILHEMGESQKQVMSQKPPARG